MGFFLLIIELSFNAGDCFLKNPDLPATRKTKFTKSFMHKLNFRAG